MIDVPYPHLSFAMKYTLKSDIICPQPNIPDGTMVADMKDQLKVEYFTDILCPLNIFVAKQDSRFVTEMKAWKVSGMFVPHDTAVLNDMSHNNSKHLFADHQNSPQGYTKLRPADPSKWTSSLNENNYVKKMCVVDTPSKILAFPCDWPAAGQEWLERIRPYNWPPEMIVKLIRQDGARVISESAAVSSEADCEWRYAFEPAERMLVEMAISPEQSDCFKVVKLILDELEIFDIIELSLMKHVFYFMCEETNPILWNTKPGNCMISFIERLSRNVGKKFFPNYFMRDLNMFNALVSEEDHNRCSTRLSIARRHPFVCLFLVSDSSIASMLTLTSVLERVIEDAQLYSHGRDDVGSLRQCFLPLAADGIRRTVTGGRYDIAYQRCQETVYEFRSMYPEFQQNVEQFILHVFERCYTYEKWLFALYIDLSWGTHYIEAVNVEEEDTIAIAEVFGESFKEYVNTSLPTGMSMRMPVSLANVENITSTTLGISSVMHILNIPPDTELGVLLNYVNSREREVRQYIVNEPIHIKTKVLTEMNLIQRTICNLYKIKISSLDNTFEMLKDRTNQLVKDGINVKELLRKCKELISNGKFDEARRILQAIDAMQGKNNPT